jgi:hypothetical protein
VTGSPVFPSGYADPGFASVATSSPFTRQDVSGSTQTIEDFCRQNRPKRKKPTQPPTTKCVGRRALTSTERARWFARNR